MPHVFLGTLIDGNNPGYTKNATGYLIGDLLKRVFRGNIVKANVANKPREQTNAHNQMTMKTQMLWTKFLNVFRHMFSLNLFKFWQIVPDFILTSLQNKVFFYQKALTELMLFLKSYRYNCIASYLLFTYVSNVE